MKRLLVVLAMASLFIVFGVSGAGAQSAITVSDSSVQIDFPNAMTFHLKASSSAPITKASLSVNFPVSGANNTIPGNFVQGPQVDTRIVWSLSNTSSFAVGGWLPPGTSGTYSWHLADSSGNAIDTPATPFRVMDNRVTWKELKNDRVAIDWYDGDQNFGQSLFDLANKTLDNIANDIGAKVDHQIQIWMYGNDDYFKTALPPGSPEWVGGESFNEFNIVVVEASGSGQDYAARGALHEMTHQVIAEAMKGPFPQALPHWMDEGLAVYHQFIPPHLDSFLQPPLDRAIQSDTLFRLQSLDSNFPADPGQADVAYGESYGVVSFMLKQYGGDKMKQIFGLFRNGATSDEAFQKVLGMDTDALENLWRKSVGAQVKSYTKSPTATPGAVATFALSSADTPSAATATPAGVALQVTSTLSPNNAPTPTPASGGGGGGLCGGLFGGLGLVAIGAWRLRKRI